VSARLLVFACRIFIPFATQSDQPSRIDPRRCGGVGCFKSGKMYQHYGVTYYLVWDHATLVPNREIITERSKSRDKESDDSKPLVNLSSHEEDRPRGEKDMLGGRLL